LNLLGDKMLSTSARIFQRYMIPRLVVTLYYFIKYRCLISPLAKVQMASEISFGKGTVVKPFATIQNSKGEISIGKKCSIGNFAHFSSGDAIIKIGDYVRIGPSVTILSSARNFRKKDLLIIDQGFSHDDIIIGDDVLIGAGVVILKGCTIGKGAVVGANSVVSKDVPPYSIVVGAPAKVISERN
jgi:acetyltransferase-like isoleucine patch superfamily enzyme